MYARVTTVQGKPEAIDQMAGIVNTEVIPAAQKLPGFKGGYWLADRATGKGVTVTFFASEEELESSAASATKIRSSATSKAGAKVVSVEQFEVIAQA